MEAAFGAVVIVVSILGIVAALPALASGRGAYDRIGHGPLSVDDAPAPDREIDEDGSSWRRATPVASPAESRRSTSSTRC